MSIITKTGDDGTTGLMFNRRVSKAHPRPEAYGEVDYLNVCLGLCRSSCNEEAIIAFILATQSELVTIMGDLAVLTEDREQYGKAGYPLPDPGMLRRVDAFAEELESGDKIDFNGWATPGGTTLAAHFDLARVVARSCERKIVRILDEGEFVDPVILKYLNRLSDIFWLLARREETRAGALRELKANQTV